MSKPSAFPASHCLADEEPVFSCALTDGSTVSLCTSRSGVEPVESYAVSGTLDQPHRMAPAGGFQRTHLTYAGGTGGYAYSFTQGDEVAILYSISGDPPLERQGMMLADARAFTVRRALECDGATVVESDDPVVLRRVRAWASNARLQAHGLPNHP